METLQCTHSTEIGVEVESGAESGTRTGCESMVPLFRSSALPLFHPSALAAEVTGIEEGVIPHDTLVELNNINYYCVETEGWLVS
jgi:hypothetical protein